MSGNKSYDKGYRFECRARDELKRYFDKVERAHRSGAFTGEADIKFLHDLRFWTVDCKSGDGWEGKRHRARLERADLCFDGPDRKMILVTLTLPKLLELMGASIAP